MSLLGFEPRGVVAFFSDFGVRDHYVGVVKGRILKELEEWDGHSLEIKFIDITHEIPPQDVRKGALLLKFSYKYFPKGTIFLGIVDPGVGTERRALLIATPKYFFVGPDNGLFTFVLREQEPCYAYEIDVKKVIKFPYSSTFHGRDLFAPVVAKLLLREKIETFAKPIKKEKLVYLDFPYPLKIEEGFRLSIWYVDHFGNLITNFSKELADKPFEVWVNNKRVRLVSTYAEGREGEIVSLFGSEGLLEIAIKNGSAFEVLGYPEIEIRYSKGL
ncbi:MAG: SAM hydrolase/SAM-dependent halogenase family protein [Caldimicrobium sp.]